MNELLQSLGINVKEVEKLASISHHEDVQEKINQLKEEMKEKINSINNCVIEINEEWKETNFNLFLKGKITFIDFKQMEPNMGFRSEANEWKQVKVENAYQMTIGMQDTGFYFYMYKMDGKWFPCKEIIHKDFCYPKDCPVCKKRQSQQHICAILSDNHERFIDRIKKDAKTRIPFMFHFPGEMISYEEGFALAKKEEIQKTLR